MVVFVDFRLREELVAATFCSLEIHIGEGDDFDSEGLGRFQMILGDAATADERELMRFGATRTSWSVIEFGRSHFGISNSDFGMVIGRPLKSCVT